MSTLEVQHKRTPKSKQIINEARRGLEFQRAEFISQITRHYTGGDKRANVRILTPRTSRDKELFINGRKVGAFLAEKEWLVFSVHNNPRDNGVD